MKQAPKPAANRAAAALIVLAAVVAVGLVLGIPAWRGSIWVYPIAGILVYYGLAAAVSGDFNPLSLAMGADGLLSVSKSQFLLWNASAVFAYLWIYAVRFGESGFTGITVPHNLLYAMGFSIVTAASAKGITTAYVRSGRVSKPVQPAQVRPSDLVACDDGSTPDLVKIQMLIWTFIAIGIFFAKVAQAVTHPALPALPDVDEASLVLMGLGQAAYLGNKLTGSDVPVLTSLSQSAGIANAEITITGNGLWGHIITLFDGQPFDGVVVVDSPSSASQFSIKIPGAFGGVSIKPGTLLQISVIVDGVRSANALPFTVT